MSETKIIQTEGCFFEADFSELQANVGLGGGKVACGNCISLCEIKGRKDAEGVQLSTDEAGKMLDACNASFETRRRLHIARRLIANDGKGCIVDDDFGMSGEAFLFLDKSWDDPEATMAVGYAEDNINDHWRPQA